jgi:hypothetical protein
MASNKPFSLRHGIKPPPSPVVGDAPVSLRYFVLLMLQKGSPKSPHQAAAWIERFLRRPAFSTAFHNPHDPSAWQRLYEVIQRFEWWQVYEFIEYFFKIPSFYPQQKLIAELNELFVAENILYRMTDVGEIVYRGSEAFETIVESAEASLGAAGKSTAREELREALYDLSKRPEPDLTGAVQHAMAALECTSNDVCGTEGETLGQVIKRHPEKFPPPLGQAVSQLYGFASEKGRHLTEGGKPQFKEVELLVSIAASVAAYLCK